MGWFKNKKSISQAYDDAKGFSKKWKFWKNHHQESYYDPKNDFRPPKKKKWKLFGRKKSQKKDEYERGRDRVNNLIK